MMSECPKLPCMKTTKIVSGIALALMCLITEAQAQYTYTILNVPGVALGISGNDIVGYDNINESFLYNGSSYTTLSVPGASVTEAVGISGNNIVGNYYNGSWQSFLYNGNGYTTLSVPGASQTFAEGISGNNIVGYDATASGQQSFLAIPVPEPGSFGLLAASAGAFFLRRRHR
jgi:PEP-CTERM motif